MQCQQDFLVVCIVLRDRIPNSNHYDLISALGKQLLLALLSRLMEHKRLLEPGAVLALNYGGWFRAAIVLHKDDVESRWLKPVILATVSVRLQSVTLLVNGHCQHFAIQIDCLGEADGEACDLIGVI